MKKLKENKLHLILVFALFLFAGLIEYLVFLHYNELTVSPWALSRRLIIRPVYNSNGSWFHARIGIGYLRWLQILEDLVSILLLLYLYRFIDAWNLFFRINRSWLYMLDFSAANLLYRLYTNLRGAFTLDYFRITNSTYDLPDLYLGISFVGIVLWLMPSLYEYYRYKRQRTEGFRFMDKLIWELKLTGVFLKTPFLPRQKWQGAFERFDQNL